MAWTLCLVIGACSGFVAGLLGVGGGTVVVPALLLCARVFGIDADDAAPVAVATSLAILVPTSMSSARAHARRGSIDWGVFQCLAPGIACGALAGTWLSASLGGRALMATFVAVALLACRQLLMQKAIGGSEGGCSEGEGIALPGAGALSRRGVAIGLVSALARFGGGLLSVPMLAHYLPMRRAIGTTAALGLPLAGAGLAGYWLAGHPARCAAGCVGDVFVPAVLAVSLSAIVAAPLGASLASRLPVCALKRAFAVLLVLVCADLARGIFR
jgi:uncharacterized membrane protein YfcA